MSCRTADLKISLASCKNSYIHKLDYMQQHLQFCIPRNNDIAHWNCSPTCLVVKPVTQMYRNIASCSSRKTSLELEYPRTQSSVTSYRNASWCMPSLQQMHSGCPVRSSMIHCYPKRIELWDGMGSLQMVNYMISVTTHNITWRMTKLKMGRMCLDSAAAWIVGMTVFT